MAHYTGYDVGRRSRRPTRAPAAPGAPGDSGGLGARAAQYIRMSTDHQLCSPGLQREAIARYAAEHGLEVVRTYADEGKSGLSVQGRAGLCSLLEDVACGRADYGVILVYDVSRWGRFQDTDESAHYEFLCRQAGIRVEYCMECFINDGTPMSAVIKSIKRIMAGEYSRELSQKTYAAKCRLTRMGYRQGGIAGYGLRRLLLDASGAPRMVLEEGQAKCIHGDRVVLIPGPARELRVLRWMFRQVAYHGRTPTFIARALNARGVVSPGNRPWSVQRVSGMLENEKYIGNLVFNRTSVKLKTRLVHNPPERWLRVDGAFPAVVEPKLFDRTQAVMAVWSTRISNQAAMEKLRALYARHGRLSAALINATTGMPGSVLYENRFGGLNRVYALVGYKPLRDYKYLDGYAERTRQVVALRAEVVRRLVERGAAVTRKARNLFTVNGRRLAVMLARCETWKGRPRWRVQLHLRPHPDWVLIARLDQKGKIQDYCLVPSGADCILLGVRHRKAKERRYAESLDPLLDLIANRGGAES